MAKFYFTAHDRFGTLLHVTAEIKDWEKDILAHPHTIPQMQLVHHDGTIYRSKNTIIGELLETKKEKWSPPREDMWHPIGFLQIHHDSGGKGVVKMVRGDYTKLNGKRQVPPDVREKAELDRKINELMGDD